MLVPTIFSSNLVKSLHPKFVFALLCLISTTAWGAPFTTIEFPSEDGLTITADLYLAHKDRHTPFIVLFHQAGWSRGEYRETAPRLNAMGFNAMAVDQRSGDTVNGVENATARLAQAQGKPARYLDAMADMRAALAYARGHYAQGKLIAWGSSYSSALVLVLAGENPELADATLSFSPGEYFTQLGKSATWIRRHAANIRKPVFITSARDEHHAWANIYAAIPAASKTSYIPASSGHHGSRALWKEFSDSTGYWQAVTAFLDQYGK